MAAGIPARLTASEGRKFGLTLGGAFLAIGFALLWRHRVARADIAFGIAACFTAAGLLVPTHLGPVERGWMRMARLLSRLTTPLFMGVVYYAVMTPIGFIRRRAGSPLVAGPRPASRWESHTASSSSERMERQF